TPRVTFPPVRRSSPRDEEQPQRPAPAEEPIRRGGSLGRARSGGAPLDLSHDVPLATARRRRAPSEEGEPDLLPDQRRGARGDPRRRRSLAEARARLVLPVLPRSRADAPARDDAEGAPDGGVRLGGRSELRRAADALALRLEGPERRHAVEPDGNAVPAGGRLRRGGPAPRAPRGDRRPVGPLRARRDR